MCCTSSQNFCLWSATPNPSIFWEKEAAVTGGWECGYHLGLSHTHTHDCEIPHTPSTSHAHYHPQRYSESGLRTQAPSFCSVAKARLPFVVLLYRCIQVFQFHPVWSSCLRLEKTGKMVLVSHRKRHIFFKKSKQVNPSFLFPRCIILWFSTSQCLVN